MHISVGPRFFQREKRLQSWSLRFAQGPLDISGHRRKLRIRPSPIQVGRGVGGWEYAHMMQNMLICMRSLWLEPGPFQCELEYAEVKVGPLPGAPGPLG